MKISLDEELAPMTIEKKLKSWEPFWSYKLNSPVKLVHPLHELGKWAGLAGLFSW